LVQQRRSAPAGKKRICLAAPSRFRLWDDAGHALACAAQSGMADRAELRRLDPDDPAQSSPLALTKLAAECDVLISTNFTRADLSHALSPDLAWISWLTVKNIPPIASAGPKDRLLLAEAEWVKTAKENGWPADRFHVATWPRLKLEAPAQGAPIGIIADTMVVPAITERFELSSHNLLWELIYDNLSANPFGLGDLGNYIQQRMRRLNIADEHFDGRPFIDELITPLYQQLVARTLMKAQVPVVVYGEGWDQLPEFGSCRRGTVRSREQFEQIVQSCGAIADVSPIRNPAMQIGRPLLRHMGGSESLIANARRVLAGRIDSPGNQDLLSGPLLARVAGLES